MTDFGNLFEPLRIGKMRVDNRLLMSAMSINFGVDSKGHVTDQLIQYLAALPASEVGMLVSTARRLEVQEVKEAQEVTSAK